MSALTWIRGRHRCAIVETARADALQYSLDSDRMSPIDASVYFMTPYAMMR
jgi:hypothetical protein